MSRTHRIGRDVLASLLSHKQRALLMMLGETTLDANDLERPVE